MSHSEKLLEFALWYAERNWPVLPLHTPVNGGCSCGKKCGSEGKHPRWHKDLLPNGALSATTEVELIKRWWRKWPHANVGVGTGAKSFDVLDVDVDETADGNNTLSELEHKHGHLPETPEQLTGGGGRQILFKHSGRMGNAVKFAPGLDTRGQGGLIVAPPSLHATGRLYEWEVSSQPDEMELAPCPEWLLTLVEAKAPAGQFNKNEDGWVEATLEGAVQGGRHYAAVKLAGYFFGRHLRAKEILALLQLWNERNQPPLPDSEIEGIVRKGSKWSAFEGTEQTHGRIKVNYIGRG